MIHQHSFPIRSATHSVLVLMLVVVLASVPACSGDAGPVIADKADDVRPIATGAPAPRFRVSTVAGDSFVFEPAELQRPAIIITFRGGWCPYCNMHLSELRHVLAEIGEMGIDVLFLSGDRPELLYRGLSEDTQRDIDGRDYRILSDAEANAAIALGIAFRASERTIDRRHERGDDIAGSSMTKRRILPVPAVFAIGADGLVKFAFAAPDYKIRLPAEELLAVANTLAAR